MVLRNTFWGMSGDVVARVVKLAQVLAIARLLEVSEVGRYNRAFAAASIFAAFFDFGITTVAIRDVLRQDRPFRTFLTYGYLKIGIVLLSLAGLFLYLGVGRTTPADPALIILLGTSLALNDVGAYIFVLYRVRGLFWKESIWRGVTALLQLATCFGIILSTRRVDLMCAGFGGAALLSLVPLWHEARAFGREESWAISPRDLAGALVQCLPLAVTAVVVSVYINWDVVMLGKFAALAAVGWYAMGAKTMWALLGTPLNYFQIALMPKLAAGGGEGRWEAVSAQWLRAYLLTTTAGAILALGMMLTARWLVPMLFGAAFRPAVPVIEDFTAIGYLFYLYTPLAQWLLICRQQYSSLVIHLAAAGFNLMSLGLLVPRWDVWGAVAGTALTHALIAVLHYLWVWKRTSLTGARRTWMGIIRVTLGFDVALTCLWISPHPWTGRLCGIVGFCACAHRELAELGRECWGRFEAGSSWATANP